ncbi:MAG: phosphate transport system permease protein [Shewanella sp.]|jgi:phosphate transport system permease protein|uniref:phosphate ABC transporter permease subunit PstC n=1 Tax=Shewanella TaxID=22 RepID=UPI001672BBDA|nr:MULTISPECIES: phosphate ABC transporter permease subunit PstC [Shewanella]MBO1272598.1 phosphate ABC transporter permease subunit PstC [Shewanella sp. 4t3-1-2LB]MCL2907035.1 phosphate ABC transporter permease subunit PstC [Shewanella fodinae]MDN5369135.1 phosphate transport system permease protein [Shewanella sp.]GGZ04627.1 phosphate transport system permease protein [Shewanella fodinae]
MTAISLRALPWQGDDLFRRACLTSAGLISVLMFAILLSLCIGAWPALEKFGVGFFFSSEWNPVTKEFGAANALYGTLVSSVIAVFLALPVGLGIAIFLSELCPVWLSRPLSIAIELLAAVPSIIYGMWGLFVFAPWFSEGFQVWAGEHLSELPIIGQLFSGPPMGVGLLTSGIILAFMILPILTSLIKEALSTVPKVLREATYGIGATQFEVIIKVLLPAIKGPIFGALILALGRALGETMAITFVIGGAQSIESSLFMPATSISATIAEQFNEATGDMHISALIGLGLVLFMITFIVMGTARVLLRRKAQ